MYSHPALTNDQILDETVVLTRQDKTGEWRAYAEDIAVEYGIATSLMYCDSLFCELSGKGERHLAGVVETKHVKPTNHNAFDGGDIVKLSCGTWLI